MIASRNNDLEQMVLVSLINYPKSYYRLPEKFTADHFEKLAHQRIFQAIRYFNSAGERYDWVVISDYLTSKKQLEQAGGENYIKHLMEQINSEVSLIDIHANTIIAQANLRQARNLFSDLKELVDTGTSVNDAIERTAQKLLDLTSHTSNSTVEGFSSIVDRYHESLVTVASMTEEDRALSTQGLSTGLVDLDRMLNGGLKAGQMIVVAGRPGMGKSLLGLNIMRSMAKNSPQAPIIGFSMEMTKDNDLAPRLLADTLNIPLKHLTTGKLNSNDLESWNQGIKQAKSLNLYFDDQTTNIDAMRIECRKLAAKHGGKLGAIFIDYLQLANDANKNRFDEVSSISRKLKGLAKAMNCPVIALSQLSRKCEERGKNKRPLVSDLRESGQIEQDADVILLLYRDDVYAKAENRASTGAGICEVDVAKHRNGGVGVVFTRFNGHCQRLEDLDPHHYEDLNHD